MNIDINENYKKLKIIENEMKFLTKSPLRIKILNMISEAPYNITEISTITGISYSTVSTNITKLEENEFIKKEEQNKFYITPLTAMYLENIREFEKSIKIINKFKELWNQHIISDFNENALITLSKLSNSKIIKSTPTDIFKTHNIIKNKILKSKNLKIIIPYLHPEYPLIIENILKNDGKIEIITNKDILDNMLYNINGKLRTEEKFKSYPKNKPISIFLTICDSYMSLGLFKEDGTFDQNKILVSENKKAIKWANELFEAIKKEK